MLDIFWVSGSQVYFEHVFYFIDAILSTSEFCIDDTMHMRKQCYTCTFLCIIRIDSPMTFINVLESLIKVVYSKNSHVGQ